MILFGKPVSTFRIMLQTSHRERITMSKPQLRSRRDVLASAGAFAALAAFPSSATAAGADVTGRLARYMVSARDRALPDAVLVACKHRILDTFGAMVSGARMKPGVL